MNDTILVYTNSAGFQMLAMPDGTHIPCVIFTDVMQDADMGMSMRCTVWAKIYARLATPDEAKAIEARRRKTLTGGG